jgi:hypothetical protein
VNKTSKILDNLPPYYLEVIWVDKNGNKSVGKLIETPGSWWGAIYNKVKIEGHEKLRPITDFVCWNSTSKIEKKQIQQGIKKLLLLGNRK